MSPYERLRVAIEASGLTLKEYAKRSGIAHKTLQNYATGTRKIGIEAMIGMCNQMGLNLNWLASGQGEMYRQDSKPAAPVTDELAGLLPQLTPAQQRAVLEDVKEKARLNALEIRLQKLEGE